MSYSMRGFGLGGDLQQVSRTNGCSTAGIAPLDAQLVAEMVALSEGKLSRVESANVKFTSDRVHPYLITAARDALVRAAEGGEIKVNSALRTFADQYLLHKGCRGAAIPGGSNHESGKAIDVNNYSERKAALLAAGFRQPVSTNPSYFEYAGDDLRKNSVKAFQRLWNLNNPTDRINEDGTADAATLARIAKAPAEGFATVPPPVVATPPLNFSDLTQPVVSDAPPVPVRYDEPRLPSSGGSGISMGAVAGVAVAAGVVGLLWWAVKQQARESSGGAASGLRQNRSPRSRSPRRNPTTYVVEPECVHCGAPMGEGITGVREMREGDKLGERGLNDDEIPERFQVAAAHAHPRQAIKRWGTCRDCRDY
jgi:hypothetical protein